MQINIAAEVLQNGDLLLTISEEDRQRLEAMRIADLHAWESISIINVIFEVFLQTSKFRWIDGASIGAYTNSAPILALGKQAWYYQDQIILMQDELLVTGKLRFLSGD